MPAGSIPTVINGGIINAYGTNARLGARRLDGGGVRRIRRLVPAPAGDHRRRHQRRSRASRPLRHLRRAARRLRALRREHPVLRLRRAVRRPSRGAGADPARRRPPHHHLRPGRQRRRARAQPQARPRRRRLRRRRSRTAPPTPSRTIVDLRLPMFGQHNVQNALAAIAVAPGDGPARRDHPPGAGGLRRRQAPLHQDRRGARHHRDRRLRPSSGRDRRRAARRAPEPMAAPAG